jgi:hypothetical protein
MPLSDKATNRLGVGVVAGAALLVWRRERRRRQLRTSAAAADAADAAAADASPPVITSFEDDRLQWDGGAPRTFSTSAGGAELRVTPAPGRDYWCRTFYSPLLVKHDAQTLLAEVSAAAEATLTTAFTLAPRAQFDQAGVMVKVDEGCWVKAGIEFTDGVPRLSCVVTNGGFSDWSTQAWAASVPLGGDLGGGKDGGRGGAGGGRGGGVTTAARVRVSKLLPGAAQGPALVMEACAYRDGDGAQSEGDWVQVRIASLRSGSKPWRMGVFAICPVANEGGGCSARFHHIELGGKCEPVHKADNPLNG